MTSDDMSPEQDRIDDEASEWMEAHDAGLSPAKEAEFRRWLSADPSHHVVWQEFERAFRPLEAVRQSQVAEGMLFELDRRSTRRKNLRRWRLLAGSVTAVAAAALVAVMFFRPEVSPLPDTPTVSGEVVINEPEKLLLPDGSLIELNVGAVVEVAFTPAKRHVTLRKGEAHFSVEKDPNRPFVVSSRGIDVSAIGTAFTVTTSESGVSVLVTQGRVAVAQVVKDPGQAIEPTEGKPLFANAGMRVSISTGSEPIVAAVEPGQLHDALAWRTPRLELSGSTLAEAVAAFNRENRVQIRIADASLSDLQLSGTFRIDDAEGFVRVLELFFGVSVERNGSELILRTAR